MLQVTSATAQGGRPHQEDRLLTAEIKHPGGILLAVFDGHGGPEAAQLAAQQTVEGFQQALREHRDNPSEALRGLFKQLVRETDQLESGSTASIQFIPSDAKQAFLGVLGDSPIALIDTAGKVFIGPDHNVRSNRAERAAAEERGGRYAWGYLEDAASPGAGLQMARALGDKALARVLSREPDVHAVRLGAQSCGLIGPDGLFSPVGGSPPEQLAQVMTAVRNGAEAQALVDDALRRGSEDNVSVIVWRLIRD
jgi:serine/threonine protein phosphatase PrpC